jgi:ATP-dependent DNA helicase DinG
MSALADLFSKAGPLSKAAPSFRTRPGQIELACAIEATLKDRQQLIAEAGTGIGKTFAYLVPLLQHGGKSLISTATRHLQDQLFERDLPRIKSALGISAEIALLKGRSNYLCLHRLEQHREDGRFTRAEDAAAFREIIFFSGITTQGDIAECATVPETSPVWSMATSTRENCLGQSCPQVKECHVMAARKRASEADIVVVNHHLFCADLALRDEGLGDLLPTVDNIVIDEAHALAEIAAQFFGKSISTAMLTGLARDTLAVGLTHARDGASWPDLCAAIDRAAAELKLLLASPADASLTAGSRIGWDRLSTLQRSAWLAKVSDALDAVTLCQASLEVNAPRHIELAQLEARAQDVMERLKWFHQESDQEDEPLVRWIEASRYAVTLHLTPYDISARFREEAAKNQRAWIFVSATLTIGGRFQHFQERLGLTQARCLIAQSPFDYSQQGLLVVPQDCPDPKSSNLLTLLLEQPEIQELMVAITGGIFILCTSHRAVEQGRQFVKTWGVAHPDRLMLVQGDAPRHQMIEQFRAHGRAVLVGSQSFWEGVDVPGSALSLVIIDKLPFAPPDDPVLEARSRWCRRQGRDPFMSIQLPEAAISLKQGVGRLIRSESDRGLVLVGDRRLADTAYGRQLLRSLPPFQRTRSLPFAVDWYRTLAPADHQNLSLDQTDGLLLSMPPRSLGL